MNEVHNPFTHHHSHDHTQEREPEVYDPAQESLADALRFSFWILKILMIVVVGFYAFSNWFNVEQQQVVVRLRLGRIVGATLQTQVLGPGGPYLGFPYPFEQKIEVSTTPRRVRFDKEFWWEVQEGRSTDQPKLGPLNPTRDGSLLTGDANVMHARWSMTYQIKRDPSGNIDPKAVLEYLHNVGDEDDADQIIRAAAEEGIVQTAAVTRSDDLMKSRFDTSAAKQRIQQTLDTLRTGLKVTLLAIERPTMPGPVRGVYTRVTQAVAEKGKRIDEARTRRDEILKNVAGDAHQPLWQLIQAYEQAHVGHSEQDQVRADALLTSLANVIRSKTVDRDDVPEVLKLNAPVRIDGQVASVISQALAYRTEVVNAAKREAAQFSKLLPQFKKNPVVFMTNRLSATLEAILTSKTVNTYYTDEKVQIYIESGPDPKIQERDEIEKLSEEQNSP